MPFCQPARRLKGFKAELKVDPRMLGRQGKRAEEVFYDSLPVINKRSHQPPVGLSVDSQGLAGGFQRAFQHGSPPAVQRVRHGRIWMNPFQTVLSQGQRAEKWR